MTQKTIKERIAIMQAYLDGQAIQSRYAIEDAWHDDLEPLFDWSHYDYRIKSRPWRAPYCGSYYYITSGTGVALETDNRRPIDETHYSFGNYFATEEEAKAVALEFNQLLAKHRQPQI